MTGGRGRQKGFTLIELVVVIVILGILAAIAVPRYAAYTRDARIAALDGVAGAIRSAVVIVQARYVATGATTSPVTMRDNTTVDVATSATLGGIPLSTAGGIDNAVRVDGTFTYTAGAATGQYDFLTPIANCFVTYTAATGAVTKTTGGC